MQTHVVGHGDGAALALALTDRPVLGESAGTGDGWLVGTGVCADGIGAAIGLDGAEVLSVLARVVGAVGLDYVVLGLRRVDPAVDREV